MAPAKAPCVAWLLYRTTEPDPFKRIVPVFVTAPSRVVDPLIFNVPKAVMVMGSTSVPPPQLNVPWLLIKPPLIVPLPPSPRTPLAPTDAFVITTVCALLVSVCWPLAPPKTRLKTFTLVSTVTVYVPATVMSAVSTAPGTTWASQLAGALQLPPLVLVQVIVAPRRSAATSNASNPAIRADFWYVIIFLNSK